MHESAALLFPPPSSSQILTMFEDNYPEGLKRVFLIKGTRPEQAFSPVILWGVCSLWVESVMCLHLPAAAPKMLPVAYNLIKHFMCEETRRKIVVIGSESAFSLFVTLSWCVHHTWLFLSMFRDQIWISSNNNILIQMTLLMLLILINKMDPESGYWSIYEWKRSAVWWLYFEGF